MSGTSLRYCQTVREIISEDFSLTSVNSSCVKNKKKKKAHKKNLPSLMAALENCFLETDVTCVTALLGLCQCSYVSDVGVMKCQTLAS